MKILLTLPPDDVQPPKAKQLAFGVNDECVVSDLMADTGVLLRQFISDPSSLSPSECFDLLLELRRDLQERIRAAKESTAELLAEHRKISVTLHKLQNASRECLNRALDPRRAL